MLVAIGKIPFVIRTYKKFTKGERSRADSVRQKAEIEHSRERSFYFRPRQLFVEPLKTFKKMSDSTDAGLKTLLIVDVNEGTYQVVKGQNPDGTPHTGPKNDGAGPFMEVGNADILDSLIRNYNRQNEKPRGLRFLWAPIEKLTEIIKDAVNYSQDRSSENFMKIKPYDERERRFAREEVPWDELQQRGLSREYAEKTGIDEKLMAGEWTDLMPVSIRDEGFRFNGLASYGLTRNPETGEVLVNANGLQNEVILNYPYKNYKFTADDIRSLSETGQLGKPVTLTGYGGKQYEALVGLHPITNQPSDTNVENLRLPKTIKGVNISNAHGRLKGGEEILVEGMQGVNGTYSRYVRVNGATGELDFRNPNAQRQEQVKQLTRIANKELSPEQMRKYEAGERVDMGSLHTKQGKYVPPVIYKGVDGKPRFSERTEVEKSAFDNTKVQPDRPAQTEQAPGAGATAQTPDSSGQSAKDTASGTTIEVTGPVADALKHQHDKPEIKPEVKPAQDVNKNKGMRPRR